MKPQNHSRRKSGRRADAPIRFQVAVGIPVPPEAVFAYLSDLENNPQWNWAVTATNPLDQRRGRGARYRQDYAWPRPGHDLLEVTAYHPPRLLEVVARERQDGAVSYRYRLAAIGGTSTRLEVSVELKPTEATSRPDMYVARVGTAIASNLDNLRTVLIEMHTPTTIPLGR
jgi:uncharacterized protein YndB with AHSA1/START domain